MDWRPNGLELSGPAKARSEYRAELAGSALEDPAFFAGQRDWNEKAGTSSRDALSWAHQINAVYLRSCQRQEIPAYEQE